MYKNKKEKGLKLLRKNQGKKPIHECKNCNCNRYSPCTCKKKFN